jgi:hypothetical protein
VKTYNSFGAAARPVSMTASGKVAGRIEGIMEESSVLTDYQMKSYNQQQEITNTGDDSSSSDEDDDFQG